MLVKGYSAPQTIKNVSGHFYLAFDSVQLLMGVREYNYQHHAHQHAYFNADVLHCDISVGNILITYETRNYHLRDNLTKQ